LFDSRYLLPPEQIIENYFNDQTSYSPDSYNVRNTTFPDFIKLPANHKYKCDEDFYKKKIESSLLWNIGVLRAESGDKLLYEILKNRRETLEKVELTLKDNLRSIYAKRGIKIDERRIDIEAFSQIKDIIEDQGFLENEYFDSLLTNFWDFYLKFYAWLDKYYLHTKWLRRSFFIALYRGLTVLIADIGDPIRLPPALENELDITNVSHFLDDLPEPEPFLFDLFSQFSHKPIENALQKGWQASPFSIRDKPPQYKEQEVKKFINYLDNLEIIKGEEIECRNRIIKSFEEHIEHYLDKMLPIIKKHLKTNDGAPDKFNSIEWLLSWNVEKLSALEIIKKFNLGYEEIEIYKKLSDLKVYDLPKQTRKNSRKNSRNKTQTK
jgi:hypothetical protein